MFIPKNPVLPPENTPLPLLSPIETINTQKTKQFVKSIFVHKEASHQETQVLKIIDSLFEEEQNFLSHSRLDHPFDFPNLGSSPSPLAAHILGDFLIKDTTLEGLTVNTTARYMKEFIDYLAAGKGQLGLQAAFSNELISLSKTYQQIQTSAEDILNLSISPLDLLVDKELFLKSSQNAKAIYTLSLQFARTIYTLKAGQSYSMEGGWGGLPTGHAMVYTFVKNANGSYDIVISNTGAGCELAHDLLADKNKQKIRPLVLYSKVPAEKLFFSRTQENIHPIRFQAIVECLTAPKMNRLRDIKPDAIYENIWGDLAKYMVPIDQSIIGWMAPQKSGTCAFRALLPIAYYFLTKNTPEYENKKAAYKAFKYELSFAALISYYQSSKAILDQDTEQASIARNLLQDAAAKFLRNASKLYQPLSKSSSKVLEKDKALIAYASAKLLLKRLEAHRQNIEIKRKTQSTPLCADTFLENPNAKELVIDVITDAKDSIIYLPTASITNINSIPYQEISCSNPIHLLDSLRMLADLLKRDFEDDFAKKMQIEKFVAALPIPSSNSIHKNEFWHQIPKENLPKCTNYLSALLNTYAEEVLKPTASFPEENDTIFALYAMMHAMAARIDSHDGKNRGLLSQYGLFFPIKHLLIDSHTVYFDPKLFSRRASIASYFHNLPDKKIFDFSKLKTVKDSILDDPTGTFYHSLIKNNPDLEQALLRKSNANIDPKVYCKLKPITCYVAELISESGIYPKSTLCNHGLDHLHVLKSAALIAQLACGFSTGTAGNSLISQVLITIKNPYYDPYLPQSKTNPPPEAIDFTFSLGTIDFMDEPKKDPLSKDMHAPLSDELNQFLRVYEGNVRFIDEQTRIPSEGAAITRQKIIKDSFPLEKMFSRSACEPDLQPYVILDHFIQNSEILEDTQIQTMFEILFFKHISEQKHSQINHVYPLIKQLATEPSLLNQIGQLISTGLQKFYFQRPGKRPAIHSALFFLRLSLKIKLILAKEGLKDNLNALPDEKAYIQEWLLRNDLTKKETSALHLYLVACFSHVDSLKIDDEAVQLIIPSWIHFNQEKLEGIYSHPAFEKQVREWYYQNGDLFKQQLINDPNLARATLNQCLNQFNLEKKLNNNWVCSHPVYKLIIDKNNFWKINILTGSILNQSGLLMSALSRNLNDQSYKRLFGNQQFNTWTTGSVSYFYSPHYGTIKIFNRGYLHIIQKQDLHGEWSQYIPENTFEKVLPIALIKDHSHWMPLKENSSLKVEICNLQSGLPIASITNDYSIEMKDPQRTVIIPQVETAFFKQLDLIDESRAQLITQDKNLNCTFTFSRYISVDQNPLSFEASPEEPNILRWSENHNLHICENKPQGLAGSIPNYIALANQNNEIKKVLIPCQRPSCSKNFSSFATLDVKRSLTFHSPLSDKKQNSCELQKDTYFEYDLQKDNLIAHNTEGQLFLALLHLSQKEEEKALHCLRQLTQMDEISPLSLKLLHWIICSGSYLHNKTPQGAAFRLQTCHFLHNASKRPDYKHSEESTFFDRLGESFLNDYTIYCDNLASVSALLTLNLEDEKQLVSGTWMELIIKKLNKENKLLPPHIENRLIYLNKGSYPSANIRAIDVNSAEKPFPYRNSTKYYPYDNFDDKSESDFYDNKTLFLVRDQKLSPFLLHSIIPKAVLPNFRNLYTMAKDGTAEEKDFVRFLLKNTSGDVNKISPAFSILQYVLDRPFWSFPYRLPPLDADAKTRAKWLQTAGEPHSNIYSSNHSYYIKNSKVQPFTNAHHPYPLKIAMPKPDDKQESLLQMPPLALAEYPKYSIEIIAKTYLKQTPHRKKAEAEAPPFFIEANIALREEELCYLQAVNEDLLEFKNEFEKGRNENMARQDFIYASPAAKDHIKAALEEKITQAKAALKPLIDKILLTANERSRQMDLRQRELMLREGKVEKHLTIPDLIQAFLNKKRQSFIDLNPYLSLEDIDMLYQWIGEYLLISTQLQLAERSLKILNDIEKLPQNDTLTKFYLLQQLGATLLAPCTYNPSKDIDCLVFEYQSNMRIRPKQFKLITKMTETNQNSRYANLVIQLGMGEGKTSVLASLLGYLAATNPGRLSLFMVPGPLFETVKENLKKSQKQNFNQEVDAIDFERRKFDLQNLMWLQKKFEAAIEKRHLILMKGEMIQSLSLEYIHLISILTHQEGKDKTIEMKITILRTILNILNNQTDALGDEVDQLLNVLKAVNFPEGSEEGFKAERADLIREIYSLLSSDKVCLDNNPQFPLSKVVGLKENKQTLLPEETYHSTIKPLIAKHLAKSYSPLNIPKEYYHAFIRYIQNTINPKLQSFISKETPHDLSLQEVEDLQFLKHLHKCSSSSNNSEQECAHLIALSRHLLNQIIPSTLSKNGNRHYGRVKSGDFGKVVPYLGVDTPATTLFGNHYEAACYHMQTAILCGVADKQIMGLAEALTKSAEFFSQKHKKPFDETPEAEEFKMLTSVDLHLIKESGKLQEAVNYVNLDISRILRIETETIISKVTYHRQKLSSTPPMLVERLNSLRSFTGTPWNDKTYPASLANNTHLDEGSEGKIADEMIERQRNNPNNIIHKVSTARPKEMLANILDNHPQKRRVKGLIDAGALFKEIDNLEAPKEILEYYKEDNSIQAVVFFYRRPGEQAPDSLAMLKKGMKEPVLIKNSHPDEIAKKGVDLKNIFFYYDERHTTGTDFVQLPDAINLLTFDEGILRRTIFQSALRERQFLFSQDLEYVILKEAEKSFINNGNNIEDFILSGIKNQAIRKSKDIFRSYLQQIDNAVKEFGFLQLLATDNLEKLSKTFRTYEKSLVDEMDDSPYAQYGALDEDIPSLEALTAYAKNYQRQYDHPALHAKINEIIAYAKQSRYLPSTIKSASCKNSSASQEIEVQTEIIKEVEQVEAQLEVELLKELQNYRQFPCNTLRNETTWNEANAKNLVKGNTQNLGSHQISALQTYLNKAGSITGIHYKDSYHKIFESNIYATDNFRLTGPSPLPVFHPMQKPAEQILFVKRGGQFDAYLLSLQEANFFKNWLENCYAQDKTLLENVWLSNASGNLFSNNPYQPFPKDCKEVQDILFQVNLFNGNAQYLSENENKASEWLYRKETLTKIRFMKLKVEKNAKQRQIFYRSELFNAGKQQSGKEAVVIFNARKYDHENMKEKASKLSVQEIPSMDPNLVPYIDKTMIPHLTTPQQLQKLTIKQIPKVAPWQVKHLRQTQVPYLNKVEQIKALDAHQLPFVKSNQLNRFSTIDLQEIKNTTLIQKVPNDRIEELLVEQRQKLTKSQVQSIKKAVIIQTLSGESVAHLDQNQIPHILDTQLEFLSNEQIRYVPDSKIPLIKNHRLKHLIGAQIKQVPLHLVNHLIAEQLIECSDEQLRNIYNTDLIQRIPVMRIAALTDAKLLQLSDEQLANISDPSLVARLNKDQIAKLRNWKLLLVISKTHLENFNKDQIQSLEEALNIDKDGITALIQKLTPPQIHFLQPESLVHLLDDQHYFLYQTNHIQALPASKVWYLNKEGRKQMGLRGKAYAAFYSLFIGAASLISALACTAAVATGIFFLRNRIPILGALWNSLITPFKRLNDLFNWWQGAPPIPQVIRGADRARYYSSFVSALSYENK